MKLKAAYAPAFARDLKKVVKKGLDESELAIVINLVLENTEESKTELRRRHRMHTLKGSSECHVANAGDWLIVWREEEGKAFFQRTGTHDDIFK